MITARRRIEMSSKNLAFILGMAVGFGVALLFVVVILVIAYVIVARGDDEDV